MRARRSARAQLPPAEKARLRRAGRGAAHVREALRRLLAEPALRRAAAWPTALTVAGCTAAAALVTLAGDHHRPLRTFALAFIGASALPPTFLQPLWLRFGLAVRRSLGAVPGELERPGEPYLFMLWREGWKALRQAVAVSAGPLPVYVVLALVPGSFAIPAFGASWAAYWLVLDALELPLELQPGKLGPGAPTWFERLLRRAGRPRLLAPFRWGARFLGWCARPWRHEAKLTERHAWECLGFGLAAGVLLAVPGLGLAFRAVTIGAGTALLEELAPARRRAGPPAAPRLQS